MMIIGCDFHPSWQQVSWPETESGDCGEQKLGHASGEAPQFYQHLYKDVGHVKALAVIGFIILL